MALTFEQACQAVEAHLIATDPAGMVVARWGFENERYYSPAVGDPRFVLHGDDRYVRMDATKFLVDKTTGEVTETTFLDDPEQYSAMTLVGNEPEPAEVTSPSEQLLGG
jgi:hypothetical protein